MKPDTTLKLNEKSAILLSTHVHIGCNRTLSCKMCLLQVLLQDMFTGGSPAGCVYCRFCCRMCLVQALLQDAFTAGSPAGCVYCSSMWTASCFPVSCNSMEVDDRSHAPFNSFRLLNEDLVWHLWICFFWWVIVSQTFDRCTSVSRKVTHTWDIMFFIVCGMKMSTINISEEQPWEFISTTNVNM